MDRIKRNISYLLAVIFLFSSCVGEQYINMGTPYDIDNQLSFEASTGLTSTKAALLNPLNTTDALQSLGYFHVSAFVGSDVLLDQQKVSWSGKSWDLSFAFPCPVDSTKYFAYANWENASHSSFVVNDQGIQVKELSIEPDQLTLNGQRDYLLACNTDSAVNRRVHLHFQHPLTKVSFRAGNVAPRKIDVVITEIAICNVASRGDLVFPDAVGGSLWSNLGPKTTQFKVQGLANNVDDVREGFTVPDLSSTPTDFSRFLPIQVADDSLDNSLLLIPQEFDSWDPNGEVEAPNQGKAYVRLRILIKRAGLKPTDLNAHHFVYAGAVDTLRDRFIPTYAYAPLASIPKKTGHWQAGKQINYILNFGDNFTPSGGGGYDKDGNPILVPIRFSYPITAVVDDWLNAFVPLITITYPKH